MDTGGMYKVKRIVKFRRRVKFGEDKSKRKKHEKNI